VSYTFLPIVLSFFLEACHLLDIYVTYGNGPDIGSDLACPDGRDGIHPNAQGELHIAQAFASALQAVTGSPFAGADPLVGLLDTSSPAGREARAAVEASRMTIDLTVS
jgi:hypothetical protein